MKTIFALVAAAIALAACHSSAQNALPARGDTVLSAAAGGNDPQNWLAQKVCVDGSNHVAPIDPYSSSDPYGNGCSGYTERNIQTGDTVPYYRYTSSGDYAYVYPVTSPSGEAMFAMVRDFKPSNVPSTWYANPGYYPGHTHWDLYRIQNSWVSNATTRDTSGLNQTFLGNQNGQAMPYNGWIDFPVSYLSSMGSAAHTNAPVHSLHWEQSGYAWPLPSQSAPTSTSTQTTWYMLSGYKFDSGKVMNTLVSQHQSKPNTSSSNPDSGHMEIWYFTMPYGASRWEVWAAESCLASGCSSYISNGNCAATSPRKFSYGSSTYTYYRTNCKDWTFTRMANAGSTLPQTPVPEANMLANMHFSNDSSGTTGRLSGWSLGSLSLTQATSTNSTDQHTRYVKVKCGSSCTSATISQTLPVNRAGLYAFGVEGRTESSSGTVEVTLQQLSSSGAVLSTSTAQKSIGTKGDNSSCGSSVVLCSSYVGTRTAIPGATQVRETITLMTSGVTYDLVEADLGQE